MTQLEKAPSGISVLTFEKLTRQLKRILSEGRSRAELAVDLERARTYWEAGKVIHTYLLQGKDRAKYGEKIFPSLSKATGVSEALLGNIHLYYRSFPISSARRKLTWTHYKCLLRVKEAKQRLSLEKEAAREHWATRELEAAVRKIQQKTLPPPGKTPDKEERSKAASPLLPKKGKFFTYQIVRAQNMHEGEGGLSLDLGFRVRHEIEFQGNPQPRLGEIVQVTRTEENAASGDRYKVTRSPGLKKTDLYTYKAKAQKFYDADTFWLDVDLGFRNWCEQKVRLRGIDAAELSEAAGRKAAAYVKKVLSPVSFVVITVSGRDKFGRPLADVFYLAGEENREKVLAEGKFLNQELLDLGLAERV